MSLKFPITVNAVIFERSPMSEPYQEKLLFGGQCGDFVAVRPCDAKFEGKTFLGVLIGSIPLSQGVQFNAATGELTVRRHMHNPMIFIPEHSTVVFGCGSWWGRIKDETQLRSITNADIANVWYVKALQWLSDSSSPPSPDTNVPKPSEA